VTVPPPEPDSEEKKRSRSKTPRAAAGAGRPPRGRRLKDEAAGDTPPLDTDASAAAAGAAGASGSVAFPLLNNGPYPMVPSLPLHLPSLPLSSSTTNGLFTEEKQPEALLPGTVASSSSSSSSSPPAAPGGPAAADGSAAAPPAPVEGGADAAATEEKKKKKRKRKYVDKGIEAFRNALLNHLAEKATLTTIVPLSSDASSSSSPSSAPADPSAPSTGGPSPAALAGIPLTEEGRQQWLADYKAKISTMDVKQLVQESVKYRFACGPYVILVPNWHALREALWVHMKAKGIQKAKRTVSTKEDLIQLCIADNIQFDFSEHVKDAQSHGNKKQHQQARIKKLAEENAAIMHSPQADGSSEPAAPNAAVAAADAAVRAASGRAAAPQLAADVIKDIMQLPAPEIQSLQAWLSSHLASPLHQQPPQQRASAASSSAFSPTSSAAASSGNVAGR
jgi:hypothetical protein